MNVFDQLVAQHGAPAYLTSDDGPEFAAIAIADWCKLHNASTTFIDPGSPWQNGHTESFNSRLRDEYLNAHPFESQLEAQVLLEGRPQESGIQSRTSSQFSWLPDPGRVPGALAQATPTTTPRRVGPLTGVPAQALPRPARGPSPAF